jgi:hypothetical protein
MNEEKSCDRSYRNRNQAASGGAVYGLGMIGAAIYFIAKATTFWVGVLGFLKALIWPAILVFYALRSLGA